MANRPVLDIEINDAKWQEFLDQFEKHKDDVNAMPGVWGQIGKKLDAIGAAGLASAEATAAMAANQEKFLRSVAASSYSMEGLARHVATVGRGIHDIVGDFVKLSALTGLVGGLLGAGSLWGVDRLALSAGGARRSALGLGVTSGEQQAFGVNFGRVLDNPSGLLESIANAQSDPRQSAVFSSLGITNASSMDAAQLAPEILSRIRDQAKRVSPNMLGPTAEAYKWTDLASLDEIRRMRNTPDDEWQKMLAGNAQDRKGLASSGGDQKAWQDFTQQIARAGQTLENTLIHGLVGLAKPLEDMSKGATDLAAAFLKSPEVKSGMEAVASGLEKLAGWLSGKNVPWNSPDVATDPKMRDDHPTALGKWLYDHFDRLRQADERLWGKGAASAGGGDFRGWYSKNDPWHQEGWQQRVGLGGSPGKLMHDYFKAQGLDEATIAGFESVVQKESAFNPAAKGGGLFQFTGARADQFKALFGKRPEDASVADQLAFAMWDYKNSPEGYEKAVNSVADTPEARYSAIRKYFERPAQQYLDRDEASGRADARTFMSKYGGTDIRIAVTNTTGAQVSISSNQAAGQ